MALLPLKIFRVAEKSMEPTIGEGSYVLVHKNNSKLKNDDIVALRHPIIEVPIIKRIKKIEGDEVYVVGDNALKSDDSRNFGSVNKNAVIGRVIFVVR